MLYYADPFYDMRSGAFRWSEFGRPFSDLAAIPLILLFLSYDIQILLISAAALALAHRLSRLEGNPAAVEMARSDCRWSFYFYFIVAVALKYVLENEQFPQLSFSIELIYFLISIYVFCRFGLYLRRDKLWAGAKKRHSRRAAKDMPTEILRQHKTIIVSNRSELQKFTVFDPNEPEIVAAWEKKSTKRLEGLMRSGDALTRLNWQKSIGVFNHATLTVDSARVHLKNTLSKGEAVLRKYGIDPEAPKPTVSQSVVGEAPIANIKRDFMQRLDYGQGMGQAVGRAVAGNMPWQFALAATAFSLIMMAVNDSKLLRQIKELEGQLLVDAQAAKNDMRLMENLITTRILPQIDALISASAMLEDEIVSVRQSEQSSDADAARETAMRMAFSVAEGKQMLQTLAGD